MLSGLQTLYQIETPPEIDRLCQVRAGKRMLGNQQLLAYHIRPVDAAHLGARFVPRAEPGALPAAEIRHAARASCGLHDRHRRLSRADRKACREGVAAVAIFLRCLTRMTNR